MKAKTYAIEADWKMEELEYRNAAQRNEDMPRKSIWMSARA
jgi:hypothetical protein